MPLVDVLTDVNRITIVFRPSILVATRIMGNVTLAMLMAIQAGISESL
jgi:hypothetical protein